MSVRSCLWFLLVFAGSAAEAQPISSGITPQHAIVADFNQDGLQDIAIANAFDDTVRIHLQDNVHSFPLAQTVIVGIDPGPPANFPRYLKLSDVNRDGFPDLTVLCSGNFALGKQPSVQTLINLGNGSLGRVAADPTNSSFLTSEFPVQFDAGLFTGDSYSDLVIANLEGKSVRILEGDGTGHYTIGTTVAVNISGEGPQDVVVFDLDEDGFDDILGVTANALFLIRQDSPGAFAPVLTYTLPEPVTGLRALVIDDLDQDGSADVALADSSGKLLILYGPAVGGTLLDSEVRTDPSLGGCSDIVTILWDSDNVPDIAITNRTSDSVTLLGSLGGATSFATGHLPRRLATGDLDGDGQLDILTANEGDSSNPLNADGTVLPIPNSVPMTYQITQENVQAVEGLFELRIPHASALSIPRDEDRFWVLDSTRRTITESDMEADRRETADFGFEVGGIHFTESDEGWVVERFAQRLHEFKVEDEGKIEIEATVNFTSTTGDLGFCGLAYDDAAEVFYVSQPSIGTIVKLSSTGATLATISAQAWDMAWDDLANLLLVTHPGRSDVRAFNSTGILQAGRTFDLASVSALFDLTGVAGIGWANETNDLVMLTTGGMLVRSSIHGSVSDTNTLAPFTSLLGLDAGRDSSEFPLAAVGKDGHINIIETNQWVEEDSVALWPALIADAEFVPGGICLDSENEEFLVSDHRRAVVARFSSSGAFLGFRDETSTITSAPKLVGGIDKEEGGARLGFRSRYQVQFSGGGPTTFTGYSPISDFSLSTRYSLSSTTNPGEVTLASPPTGGEFVRTRLVEGTNQGTAFLSPNRFLAIDNPDSELIRTFAITPLPVSSVSAWDLYK